MGRCIPNWSKERYVNGFAEKWLGRWAKAVVRTERIGVFSHEEGLHSGMSGHNFVKTLRCPRQRCNINDLARKLLMLAPETFAVPDVLCEAIVARERHRAQIGLAHESGSWTCLANQLQRHALGQELLDADA